MEEIQHIIVCVALCCLSSLCIHLYNVLWLRPERLREKLRQQGIIGPPPSFLSGNVSQVKRIQQIKEGGNLTLTDDPAFFPHLEQWRKEYGPTFMFATSNVMHLYVSDPDLAKEISLCKSWDLGKPSYVRKEKQPLLGLSVITSNGQLWANQRKIIAPQFFMNKVKGMVSLMVESVLPMLKSWEDRVESERGVADIRVDEDLRNLTADVISKACFGSSYSRGKEIFSALRALEKTVSRTSLHTMIPTLRYLPTKNNREAWRLEQEVKELILKVVTQRKEQHGGESSEKDVLHMILEGAHAEQLGKKTAKRLVIDNCKSIYIAGHETVASVATWSLMLLALHPEWQCCVRAEVVEVCGDRMPDPDILHKMKGLTMVIQESLRLFPPTPFVARETFEEMKLGDIHIPKGVTLWIPIAKMHRLPEIWGPDANQFRPERFANGIFGACKLPRVFMPFGLGPRTCLGQKFATVELKIILSLILSKFSFSLSPKYRHAPAFKVLLEPQYGMNLLMKRA